MTMFIRLPQEVSLSEVIKRALGVSTQLESVTRMGIEISERAGGPLPRSYPEASISTSYLPTLYRKHGVKRKVMQLQKTISEKSLSKH